MAKADLKTRQTDSSAESFLNSVADDEQRADAFRMLEMFRRVTGEEAKMWGPSIIGFGHRVMKYESGRELDWMINGFSPRKGMFALYSLTGSEKAIELLEKLGKHKTGKGCLYIKKLTDIDEGVLEDLISESIQSYRSLEC